MKANTIIFWTDSQTLDKGYKFTKLSLHAFVRGSNAEITVVSQTLPITFFFCTSDTSDKDKVFTTPER